MLLDLSIDTLEGQRLRHIRDTWSDMRKRDGISYESMNDLYEIAIDPNSSEEQQEKALAKIAKEMRPEYREEFFYGKVVAKSKENPKQFIMRAPSPPQRINFSADTERGKALRNLKGKGNPPVTQKDIDYLSNPKTAGVNQQARLSIIRDRLSYSEQENFFYNKVVPKRSKFLGFGLGFEFKKIGAEPGELKEMEEELEDKKERKFKGKRKVSHVIGAEGWEESKEKGKENWLDDNIEADIKHQRKLDGNFNKSWWAWLRGYSAGGRISKMSLVRLGDDEKALRATYKTRTKPPESGKITVSSEGRIGISPPSLAREIGNNRQEARYAAMTIRMMYERNPQSPKPPVNLSNIHDPYLRRMTRKEFDKARPPVPYEYSDPKHRKNDDSWMRSVVGAAEKTLGGLGKVVNVLGLGVPGMIGGAIGDVAKKVTGRKAMGIIRDSHTGIRKR